MFLTNVVSRRRFFLLAAGAGLSVSGCGSKAEQGCAVEFLERQHGIQRRAVSILEEIKGGMDARMDLDPETIRGTVEILRRMVVEFHQKLEDKYVFPAFESAGKVTGLVGVLREQHEAGSQMTGILEKLAAGFSPKDHEKRRTMQNAIHHFNRMYRAHADREDTLLYPLLNQVIQPAALEKMNEAFRKEDRQVMGQNGFDEAVGKLATLENTLGIGDLASFTPRMDEFR